MTSGFVLDTPRLCAALSDLVYRERTAEVNAKALGFEGVQFIEADGALAIIAWGSGWVFVAFQGTNEIRDLVRDARYFKTDFPAGGRVHKGFFAHFLKVWPKVREVLATLPAEWLRVYTGHSLGAACAVQAAGLQPPAQAHVFGCPRVGNTEFARRIDRLCPVVRYEAPGDFITRVPPPMTPGMALASLAARRWPSLYVKEGRRVWLDAAHGHNMAGYRGALDVYFSRSASPAPV